MPFQSKLTSQILQTYKRHYTYVHTPSVMCIYEIQWMTSFLYNIKRFFVINIMLLCPQKHSTLQKLPMQNLESLFLDAKNSS